MDERYRMLRQKPDDGTSPIPGSPYYANKAYMQHPGELVFWPFNAVATFIASSLSRY